MLLNFYLSFSSFRVNRETLLHDSAFFQHVCNVRRRYINYITHVNTQGKVGTDWVITLEGLAVKFYTLESDNTQLKKVCRRKQRFHHLNT